MTLVYQYEVKLLELQWLVFTKSCP